MGLPIIILMANRVIDRCKMKPVLLSSAPSSYQNKYLKDGFDYLHHILGKRCLTIIAVPISRSMIEAGTRKTLTVSLASCTETGVILLVPLVVLILRLFTGAAATFVSLALIFKVKS